MLSKHAAWIDQTLKLRGYDAVPGILTYVLISQDEPRALLYRRDGDGRLSVRNAVLLEGMAALIDMPDLGTTLPFSGLYEGLGF